MEKEKLLNYIAPCSLLCNTCISLKDGPYSEGARNVYKYSDGWGEFWSVRLSEEKRQEWHKEWKWFQDTLQYLGGASCPGCRNNPPSNKEGWGCLEGCVIPACAKERRVDFCAECDEFPCQKAKDFFASKKSDLIDWENGNRRIKEIGLNAYFEEKKDVSHYIHCKKKVE